MEMILISSNKLKIIISDDELKGFDLTANMLDYGNTETKRMLWDLLCKAKRAVGFDPDGYRVLVQIYTEKNGGCEMFITKIVPSDASICDVFASSESDSYETDEEGDIYEDSDFQSTLVTFSMDSLGALCDACRRLSDSSFSGKSSVYIFNSVFYLVLCFDQPYVAYSADGLSFLTEYGKQILSNELLMSLYEFGRPICKKSAVDIFSKI